MGRFHAVLVDNGVLRENEAAQVKAMLSEHLGVNLTVVDASDLFLSRLADVEDPERKRKIIGNTFIEVFETEAAKIEAEAERELETGQGKEAKGKIEWLLQGTLYPDVIESISFKGPSATIKTHHNVGGLLADMQLKLIEPLRELFKGEHGLSPTLVFWTLVRLNSLRSPYRRSSRPWSVTLHTRPPRQPTSVSWPRSRHSYTGPSYSGASANCAES